MTTIKRFTLEELEGARDWELPHVDNPEQQDLTRTNALNRRSDWKYEPPEAPIEILPPTAEEIEAIRQAAYDEGFAEGKQTGYDEGKAEGLEAGKTEGLAQGHDEGLKRGLEEGQAQINQQSELWQSLADKLHEPLLQIDAQVRKEIVKLAVALARSVIRTEVTLSEQVILQALSEGLKALPVEETQFKIHMHPDDIALVTAHFGEETLQNKGWTLIETPALARGGCDIVTKNNAVDLSVERRCKNVLDKFLLEQGLSDER